MTLAQSDYQMSKTSLDEAVTQQHYWKQFQTISKTDQMQFQEVDLFLQTLHEFMPECHA